MKPLAQRLIGTWIHSLPGDSEDYFAEYQISERRGKPTVSAIDLTDGEKFKISRVSWDGEWLRFTSLMPSTRRIGLNEFRLKKNGRLASRFTFTVLEEMVSSSEALSKQNGGLGAAQPPED